MGRYNVYFSDSTAVVRLGIPIVVTMSPALEVKDGHLEVRRLFLQVPFHEASNSLEQPRAA